MNAGTNSEDRLQRARLSLEGLSLGDAFGECFFDPAAGVRIRSRKLPEGPWFYTDDTMMAKSIVDVLTECGRIEQDALAHLFARRFHEHPNRGYGAGAHRLLSQIHDGANWRSASCALFGGEGSLGNGGAMRAAPVGAYFADDPERAAFEAAASAAVTHAHVEGKAGAVAIAVGAAMAWRGRGESQPGRSLLQAAHDLTPPSATRDGVAAAAEIEPATAPEVVAMRLGSGQKIMASDTVPFSLWCAAAHVDSFENAMWKTAAGLGDVDTTCAEVGGIVALAVGMEGLPAEWFRRREPLED